MAKWKWAGIFAVLAMLSFAIYRHYVLPDDLIPMGDDETIARLAMWTAIGSAVASAFNVIKSLLDLNKDQG